MKHHPTSKSGLYFSSVIVFFSSVTSVWYFTIASVSCWSSHCVRSVFLEFGEHLYDHDFELFIRQITYLYLRWVFFSLKFCLIPLIRTYFSLSSFSLSLYIAFYALDKIDSSLSLEEVAPYRRGPVFSILPSSWLSLKPLWLSKQLILLYFIIFFFLKFYWVELLTILR